MDVLHDFLTWAWARHHNPLSWYIRPLFILPYCYFAYKKSKWGVALTIVAVLSSMFWFPAPETTDPRAAEFLAMEQQYITGSWTFGKVAMTALIPVWFVGLAWAFWRRSWLAGFVVINMGALLKVIWSFYFGGGSAWSIIPAVSLGALVINGVMLYAYRRARRRAENSLFPATQPAFAPEVGTIGGQSLGRHLAMSRGRDVPVVGRDVSRGGETLVRYAAQRARRNVHVWL